MLIGKTFFFLLGADDPEMRRIEEILKTKGIIYDYARVNGRRVHPGNAYQADPVARSFLWQFMVVECAFSGMSADTVIIDHHRPGDPGFNKGPVLYWEASSLGQFYRLLPLSEPNQSDRVLAAMDHCPVAAWRSECPGITPQEILHRKIVEIASVHHVSLDTIRNQIREFEEILIQHESIRIGTQDVIHLRRFLGHGYSIPLLCAQVAVLKIGKTALFVHKDHTHSPFKLSLYGHVTPETVEAFMTTWAPANGLKKICGVPSRGYAGGYLSVWDW